MDMLQQLYDMHKENLSEYTFGDNFAEGLVPEVMSKDFIEKIVEYEYKKPDILSRKVFDCMNADINKFFIELEIAEQDFSIMRIELIASSRRNIALLKKLLNHVRVSDKYTVYFKTIQEHPEILYIHPKYIEIEITNECNLSCVFCPRSKMQRKAEHMDLELYKKIIINLTEQYNDIVISFTLMGEPLLHPQFMEIVEETINNKNILTLIIETNGVLLNDDLIKKLSSYPPEKLILVFGIDSLKKETYNKLRRSDKKDYFERVRKNVLDFINFNKNNKMRTFIQILKMKDNNLEIEEFYNFWHSQGVNVVIQKFNTYLKTIEDRSVVDLTPLDRFPCWHIQRDLEIFSNGDVCICKQDFNGQMIMGNFNKDSLQEIHDNLKRYFLLNYKERYNEIKICSKCEEWYTYNF